MAEEMIVVTGGGGFIGGHLAGTLRTGGARVRAVDCKPLDEWEQVHPDVENLVLDVSRAEACDQAVAGADVVYNLAADMGGMGFIEANKALCMLTVLINTHLLESARQAGVEPEGRDRPRCPRWRRRWRRCSATPPRTAAGAGSPGR